jgi:hypothetical protein
MLPIDQLPPAETAAPVVDRTSLAVSVANEVTGLSASGGNEETHFMMVQIGDDGNGDSPLQIRAVTPYVPPIAPSEVDIRSVVVNEVTITWRAMPDGSVWIVSSRPSVAAAAPNQILDLITSRLADGPIPTYAPTPSTAAPN